MDRCRREIGKKSAKQRGKKEKRGKNLLKNQKENKVEKR